MSLFLSKPSSYADEQLNVHLASLATLPVTTPSEHIAKEEAKEEAKAETTDAPQTANINTPSPHLRAALGELTQAKPPSIYRLAALLEGLSEESEDGVGTKAVSELDRAAEAEVLTRAVTLIWAHVLQTFVDGALKLEDDRAWWRVALASRMGTVIYFVQSLPVRMYSVASESLKDSKESARTFSHVKMRTMIESLHWPNRAKLFRSMHGPSASGITQQLAALASPLMLTRREMHANRRALTLARDGTALRVGILATQAPQFSMQAAGMSAGADALINEASRVYSVLSDVLSVDKENSFGLGDLLSFDKGPQMAATTKLRKLDDSAPQATAADLRDILTTYLPRAQGAMSAALTEYGRPSAVVRLWFPFLFLPPALYFATSAIVRNKQWMKEQVENAKETVKGFFVQWVWEPIEEIAKTMRGGGEGLGVSPETVKADQESFERMVVSFASDYYKMTGPALENLKSQVESGDLSLVLKAYEKEMTNPIRNALAGNLVRTLLIQVQKTKTDLSLALERLDALLRSQQLTFAFVGVAPSVLVLWGVGSWLGSVWRGEHGGKDRRRRYFNGVRGVERILITAPEDDTRLSNRDRGMIIVSVSGLRTWAVGMSSTRRQNFLDDLRMVENPGLSRVDKLRVVERIWRCWGLDGRKTVV